MTPSLNAKGLNLLMPGMDGQFLLSTVLERYHYKFCPAGSVDQRRNPVLLEHDPRCWAHEHKSSLAVTGRSVCDTLATDMDAFGTNPVPVWIVTGPLCYKYSNWPQIHTAIAQFGSELKQSIASNLATLLSEEGLAQNDSWPWANPF